MIRHSCSLQKSFAWILSRLAIYEDMFSITRDFEIEYAGICQDHGRAAAAFRILRRQKGYSFINIAGLISFSTECQTKEIAIRKVLGASV